MSPVEPNRELYLNLLKRSLSGTLFAREPDADSDNSNAYVLEFVHHYINGNAISMLPLCRLDNIRTCVADIIENNIPGDLIETGVWRGGATIFMRGILKSYQITDRRVWAADSFEGLPAPDPALFPKEAAFYNGKIMQRLYKNMAASLEEVRANFVAYGLLDDQVQFVKGWFKDTLPTVQIEKLALIRLDGDYYSSTMDALTNLYHKLSPGGCVIVDDYGEDEWTNCRQAVDEFRAARGIGDPLIRVDSKCYWWCRSA